MLMKLSLILFFTFPVLGMEVAQSNATKVFKWGTGIDAPCYTEKISTGEHGALIEGDQHIFKGGNVTYEIVKRSFWRDEVYDKIEINHEGKFFAKLKAPKNEYHIRICGYSIAHGTLKISPY